MAGKEMRFYAYNPPTSGKYTINGYEYFNGEDFRNVKRYKEYQEAGFNTLLVRYENAYNGEEWETSNAKMVFERAYEAGIDKIIITDRRLDDFIHHGKLLGDEPDCRFKTEEELDEKITEFVSVYKDMPGFYGIQLVDEPKFAELVKYGQVVRSLKRVLPNAYLQCNLFPMEVSVPDTKDVYEAWRKYVNTFLDETGLDYICMDPYPFRREYIIGGLILTEHQIAAEICQKRNLKFYCVMQSFSNCTEGVMRWRPVTESDMYWQTNLAIGFGVCEYGFYTYLPKPELDYKKGYGDYNGACFLNHDGSRTALFDYTKRIIEEIKKFSNIYLNYKFKKSYIITEAGKTAKDFEWTALAYDEKGCPIGVEIDKEVALVTYSENESGKLYMIENFGNIKEELFNGAKAMRVKLSLGEGEKKFYFRGDEIKVACENGECEIFLNVGDAIFIEIKE